MLANEPRRKEGKAYRKWAAHVERLRAKIEAKSAKLAKIEAKVAQPSPKRGLSIASLAHWQGTTRYKP